MLLLYSQFILQQGIRSPLYLMNPPVINQESVSIPRDSVLHYLDLENDNQFPTRSLYYYREVPATKKLPIQHIDDLITKDDTTTLNNKLLPMDIRRWNRENLKHFRERDLYETPNRDVNMIGTFNYNPVKTLYNYRSSLISEYSQYRNLANTFWSNVKACLDGDKESHQLVPINLPSNIPGYMTLNRILGFDEKKVTRVVDDVRLLWVLDLYSWLLPSTRPNTPLASITDEDSTRILIELKYKGHSSFLPLHVLRSVAEDSELPSSMKVSESRLQKLFILTMRKIQDSVEALINSDRVEEVEELTPQLDPEVEEQEDLEEDLPVEGTGIQELKVSKVVEPKTKLTPNSLIFKEGPELEVDNIFFEKEGDFASMIDDVPDSDSFVDSIFEEKVRSVASGKPSLIPKKVPSLIGKGDMDIDLDLDDIEDEPLPLIEEETIEKLMGTKEPSKVTEEFISKAIKEKTHTAAEIRSLRKIQEERVKLKSPYNNETLDSFKSNRYRDIKLSEDLAKLNVGTDLIDESLLNDKISAFDSEYIEKMMERDVVSSIANLEKADLVIRDYTKEVTQNSTDRFETHKLTIRPLNGRDSTVYFRLPIIDDEGTFMVAGKKYRMRKQRQPVPIMKVSPIRVAITSNYGKFFVGRTERKASDREDYIVRFLRSDYLGDNEVVSKIVPGRKNLSKSKAPNIYVTLSSNFNEINLKSGITLLLREDDATNHVSPEVVKQITGNKLTFVGYNRAKDILVVDENDNFYNFSKEMEPLGGIEDILGLDREKVPKSFSVMKVLGRDIPLGVVLGYYLGLSGLLKVTDTKFQILGPRQQYQPEHNELVLRFSNHKLVVTTDTPEKQLLFNGFLFYRDTTKQFPLRAFNSKNVYLNLVEQRGQGLTHLKELDNLFDLFLDPITVDVLKGMGEPENFLPLLLRANELLKDFQHPDVNDPNYVRIRGYDRVAGLMYRALAESIREHRIRGRNNAKVSVDPYKVWNQITQDSSVKSREVLNPILTIKEDEAVTLTGADGLSSGAIPAQLRRYHPNDTGLFSEGTVDSRDVAVSSYLSPYAKISSLRGTVDKDSTEAQENPGKIFSTPAQVGPMIDGDDAKRINFIGLQYSHSIPSTGYRQAPVRTGYEYVIPNKVNSSFCVTAKEDGVITNVTDKLLTVKYKSGKEESYPIGTTYGEMEGTSYLHEIITDYKKGTKFKKDEALAYHKDFFERDWLDKSKLIMKTTVSATVAIMANNEVFEDSSAVSENFASILGTTVAEERKFILDFNQNLVNVLPPGTHVNPQDILFMALDETEDGSNLSEQTVSLLQNLASISPKARVRGVIDRIEVKYNGDLADMSPSIRRLVSSLDKETYERTKGTPYEAKNNKVNAEYRSDGKNLQLDTLELKVFIRVGLGLGIGDKLVFSNQMKSVLAEVYKYDLHTESGDVVDGMFSMQGMLNRIANSPFLIGTTARLTRHFTKQVTDAYFK